MENWEEFIHHGVCGRLPKCAQGRWIVSDAQPLPHLSGSSLLVSKRFKPGGLIYDNQSTNMHMSDIMIINQWAEYFVGLYSSLYLLLFFSSITRHNSSRYSVYPFSVLSRCGIRHPKPVPFLGNIFMFRQVRYCCNFHQTEIYPLFSSPFLLFPQTLSKSFQTMRHFTH